jgi:two-component system, NarL family, invasion response regulator UvrY
MIRILIADDHAIVRRGVRDILNELPDRIEVAEVSTAMDAIREIAAHPYDIVILDISFPDGNGLDILNQVKNIRPDIRILFLSMYPEEQYARRALKNGAYGYLTKDSAPTELVEAIQRVISGSKYVTMTLAQRLVDDLATPQVQDPHECLSDREFQVMLELARGKKISDIATELMLSPKTVSTYRGRVFQKLNLLTTAELIRYVMDHGLG